MHLDCGGISLLSLSNLINYPPVYRLIRKAESACGWLLSHLNQSAWAGSGSTVWCVSTLKILNLYWIENPISSAKITISIPIRP
jgi:hypothetical protein